MKLENEKEPEEPLFQSPYTETFYSYDTMKYMFNKICTSAEILIKGDKTPNLHSIRHTFATKSLEPMLNLGMDLYTTVPILTAYLGHVNLTDTERYIQYDEFLSSQSSKNTPIK